jgi:hypothetical protein
MTQTVYRIMNRLRWKEGAEDDYWEDHKWERWRAQTKLESFMEGEQ